MTDNAIQHIKKILAQNDLSVGFRLSIKKTGCSGYAYVTDIISKVIEGDLCHQVGDIFLYVDSKALIYLDGTVIDFVDQGLGQTKLVFHNPNAANLCGCGESFNLPEE